MLRTLFALLVLVVSVGCSRIRPGPPATADPVATQVSVALAVQATLTALAPTATLTPTDTATPRPSRTPRPTRTPTATPRPSLDTALLDTTAQLRALAAEEARILDDFGAWASSAPSEPGEWAARMQGYEDAIDALAKRVAALKVEQEHKALVDGYLAVLALRWRLFNETKTAFANMDPAAMARAQSCVVEGDQLSQAFWHMLDQLTIAASH